MNRNEFKAYISNLFFPPKCRICGEFLSDLTKHPVLCRKCYTLFSDEASEKCSVCGKEYFSCECVPEGLTPNGFLFALPYGNAFPVCSRIVLNIKDRKDRAVTDFLAKEIIKKCGKRIRGTGNAFITFVPRAKAKIMKTGTDQAKELALRLSKMTGTEFGTTLKHLASSSEQKNLTAEERFENAGMSYSVIKKSLNIISGKNVFLVDDITTTGATMNACASLLKKCGAESVVCISACRTDNKHKKRSPEVIE